jgi:2-oxoisovalerate dehydrogenase E1 component
VLPFGCAKVTMRGTDLTIVTWGAMVERVEDAAKQIAAEHGRSVEVIDLRTLMPWDRETVLESVRRTRRCLVVHEDLRSAGFGAEIGATIAEDAFMHLDAPVARLTMPDVPSPHNAVLLDAVVPSVARIRARAGELLEF